MSDDKFALFVLFVLLGLIGLGVWAAISGENADRREQARVCTEALRGITPAESVRVYRVQPKCLEAKP